ncbi:type II toxin-antitoxin system RelE/ParE family toxin [Leucothrix pacifica]|uniref:Toxin n=1 Tax=Leucothrix pacifica TaxID=1247513 RepID=A0A317CGS6_9GAMM|nr:type II toxin-antitoxin system RelE/ParE family toxin [Leucothrix pacifica]PWQ95432.1 hypothetical protein DKW60_15260 [Leucothrix pacifica]
MLKYHFTRAADDDLENIWFYGLDTWGVEQADRYYQQIINMVEHLSENPQHGKSEAIIVENLRSYPSGSHRIYYTPEESGYITIVRVLHQSMDTERHIEN